MIGQVGTFVVTTEPLAQVPAGTIAMVGAQDHDTPEHTNIIILPGQPMAGYTWRAPDRALLILVAKMVAIYPDLAT